MKEGDGSVLDQSLLLYGGGMGDGNMHRHSDLPTLMAGSLGGKFKTGRHLQHKLDTPMANLLLTIMDSGGVRLEKFGDSNGRISSRCSLLASPLSGHRRSSAPRFAHDFTSRSRNARTASSVQSHCFLVSRSREHEALTRASG